MSTEPLRLSVLDLVPVRSDQTTGDAVAASLALARTADVAGYHRYWVSEHHNSGNIVGTAPEVLLAAIGRSEEHTSELQSH